MLGLGSRFDKLIKWCHIVKLITKTKHWQEQCLRCPHLQCYGPTSQSEIRIFLRPSYNVEMILGTPTSTHINTPGYHSSPVWFTALSISVFPSITFSPSLFSVLFSHLSLFLSGTEYSSKGLLQKQHANVSSRLGLWGPYSANIIPTSWLNQSTQHAIKPLYFLHRFSDQSLKPSHKAWSYSLPWIAVISSFPSSCSDSNNINGQIVHFNKHRI